MTYSSKNGVTCLILPSGGLGEPIASHSSRMLSASKQGERRTTAAAIDESWAASIVRVCGAVRPSDGQNQKAMR